MLCHVTFLNAGDSVVDSSDALRTLIAVASLVAEHGVSVVAARGL